MSFVEPGVVIREVFGKCPMCAGLGTVQTVDGSAQCFRCRGCGEISIEREVYYPLAALQAAQAGVVGKKTSHADKELRNRDICPECHKPLLGDVYMPDHCACMRFK
jgi:hypothetical protein